MTTAVAMVDPKLEQEGLTLRQQVDQLVVTNDETFVVAGEFLKGLRVYTKRVHEVFDPIVDSAHKAHKVAVDQRKSLLKPAEDAERLIKGRVAEYQDQQRRIMEEVARQAEQERLRLEAEAQAAAEAEQARLRKEAEDAVLNAAAVAEERGDTETAERLLQQPIVTPTVVAAPVFVPLAPVVAPPKVEGLSFRGAWKASVTDFKALVRAVASGRVPITLLAVDEVALGQFARATRGAQAVPGVRFYEERSAAIHA